MKTAELIANPARPALAFPEGGKRLLVYVVYDPRGDVEDYIPHALHALRPHCTHILAVSNGPLTDRGRAQLAPVADEVLERENSGYDIWGYKAGLDAMADRLGEFDEVLLANDTWFGPVRPFGPVFERMEGRPLHFWGMTDHVRVEPHPYTQSGYLPYHLQSYWVAVRREMLESEEWHAYWRDLPEMTSYSDAVVKHEGVFTEHFTRLGFSGEVAFPTLTNKVENHAVLYAEQLLDAGCPTLKRRPFFQWPPFMDALGVVGRWTLEAVERYGYPLELIYSDLARNVAPKVLNADAAMLEVLPETRSSYDPTSPLRTLVVAHIFYVEMTAEILDRVDTLPAGYDLIVTTPDSERAAAIKAILSARPSSTERREVRVVPSNDGRDQSAFLIGCRDELLSDDYDLVVKLHSKKTPQGGRTVGAHFKNQQFDNLLRSREYAANVVALFQNEPGLGLVFPPMIHLGFPTMGHAWWANKAAFTELCARLGVRVPLDDTSPLAPYGSMFVARPAALRILVEEPWTYDEFAGAYDDGSLAHVLERLPVYAAGERGYHSRTIANRDYIASSHTTLDYNLDQMSQTLPDNTMHQIQFLKRMGYIEDGSLRDFISVFFRMYRPAHEVRAREFYDKTFRARSALRRLRQPRSWLRRPR
ncbi:rhamnan synthesis F family protein [Microbacterium yannicii]|uniref:rhamnan synthesis F family protein n=1 Tax=Microbacterium yannicii TaxID=671622 RepID=UPI0002D306B5|nr:rhamnan synthesis F family protein [Microbacterium yannicii]